MVLFHRSFSTWATNITTVCFRYVLFDSLVPYFGIFFYPITHILFKSIYILFIYLDVN